MADVVAGLLTSALVKIATDKLSFTIEEQASLALNSSSDDLRDMKDTMESIAVLLKDAEKQSIKNESVRLWLKRLKYRAFDISDMMDKYHDIGSTTKMPGMLSCFTDAHKKKVLAKKMKNMREELKLINEQCQSFNFTPIITETQDQQHYDEHETTSVNEVRILGRDEEKMKILGKLSSTGKKDGTMVLPIYGLGGVGKSTLAQLVYNDTQFKQYDHRVWVYVSEVFDLKNIGRSIISQLQPDGGHHNTDTLELVRCSLDKLLLGKKILIILDDIWKEDGTELKKLKDMLHVDKEGSTVDVIVTTRSESIANKICTNEAYRLQPLMDNVCWDIIKIYSGFEDKSNKQTLGEIGLEIARRCGGVALAAKSLGYILKSKDLNGWLEIDNSDIWTQSFIDNRVLPSLKLSYKQMLPVLRLCFSYCAIFPKGHDVYEDDLVHRWLALDFINKPSEGKEYIKQLLGMSFLQHSKIPTISRKKVTRYTMHDLVHDLARSVANDELHVIDVAWKIKKCEQKYCRYALLINYDGQTKLSDILPKRGQALHFSSNSKLGPRDGLFSAVERLRVLDFSECSGLLLPSYIDQMKQLTCLIAPKLQNRNLPEGIVELPKLQYLNVRESSLISALPESIDKLSCLIYLDMSGCLGIIKVPETFGGLKSLVRLDMSSCSGITALPDSFGNLSKLQYLDLSRCSGVKEIPESLGSLNHLQHLNLSYCDSITTLPEAIGRLNNLQYLDLQFSKTITVLPGSFQELKNLVHLDLSYCTCAKGLPEILCCLTSLGYLSMRHSNIDPSFQIDVSVATGNLTNLKYLDVSFVGYSADLIGTLTNLEHLVLRGNKDIVSLPDSIGNLKMLHTLDLSCCNSLQSLPESIGDLKKLHTLDLSFCSLQSLPESIGNLKKLHTLALSYCGNLKSIPYSIYKIPALKNLLIEGCLDQVIEMLNYYSSLQDFLLFNVRADVDNEGSNLPLLRGTNVVELRICSLENVWSIEEAYKVKMCNKKMLSDLTLAWTSSHGYRFVDDADLLKELVPPSGLKTLVLKHYSSESFPGWFMDISRHLLSLVTITLDSLPNCNNLPPFGQLPNLEVLSLISCDKLTKIGKDFCGGKEAFHRLSQFIMCKLEGLEEWCTTYCFEDGVEEFMFPVLDQLTVEECPKLRLTPCPPICRAFRVIKSDEIISSLEELRNNNGRLTSSTPTTSLQISICNSHRLNLFHHFSALKELGLFNCNQLTGLPDSMQHLKSLESLKLQYCPSISALPEWLCDFSCLKSLAIQDCKELRLWIKSGAELKRWWKLKGNMKKSSLTSTT